jgi:hypothetical protein
MKDILTARREAGTPCGIEYANRLEAMPPDEAADEIYDMFCLCADEDLGYEISCDLQLHPKAAAQIAIAIERKRAAESTSSDDDPLDWPENYLWVRLGTGRSAMIDGNRLYELLGGAPPETLTEKLLAGNSEWLRVYLAHCLGVWPITIPEYGPLPAWDAGWLRAVGETDEPLPEEVAAALRRLTDPALAWEIDDDERREIGPKWLLK